MINFVIFLLQYFNRRKLRFLGILFFLSNVAFALENTYQLKNTSIILDVPEGWYDVQGFFGADLSLLGEEAKPGENRTTISIYDAESSLNSFPVSTALKSKEQFFEGRKEWINSQDGGRYLNEVSAKELKFLDSKNSGIEMTFEYLLENKKFREYSFYVSCSNEFLFIKGLVPDAKINSEEERILKNLPKTIKCKGPGAGVTKTALNQDQLKNVLENIQKPKVASAVIVNLRKFVLKYDEKVENEHEKNDLFSENAFFKPRSLIANFFKIPLLISEATNRAMADTVYQEGGQCIFAGWVSLFTKKSNGKLTCQNPKLGSSSYGSTTCSNSNSFACNPSLFGPGVCISSADKDLNQSATFRCNEKRKSDAEILDYVNKHPDELREIVASTNQLCANSVYLKNNPELCGSLVDQLSSVTDENGQSVVSSAENAFDKYLKNKQISEDDYEKASSSVQDQLKLFEQACMTNENSYRSGVVELVGTSGKTVGSMNCEEERKSVLQNLEKLKNAEKNMI